MLLRLKKNKQVSKIAVGLGRNSCEVNMVGEAGVKCMKAGFVKAEVCCLSCCEG